MIYRINPESGMSDFFFWGKYENVFMTLHVHSHIEFVFALKGNIHITIGERSDVLRQGMMAVIMPYEMHSYSACGPGEAFVIACPPEYISGYRQKLQGRLFEPPYAAFGEASVRLMEDIVQSENRDDFRKKALVYCAISDLFQKCELAEQEAFEYDVYRKAISYISENYAEPITLKQTAFEMGVTASHLSRVLNQGGKPGFSEIVNSLRVFAAKQMLEQTALPVIEVAMETGFGSIRNFNRVFLKYFGCNPRDVRRPEGGNNG